MRVFEIRINETLVCTAGLEGSNILTAILTSHEPDRKSKTRKLFLKSDECPLDLNIAGTLLGSGDIKQWPKMVLKVGDEVSIKIRDIMPGGL
jgi:hypothetical protein